MMSGAIEALYVFNSNNESILEHVYRSRPASARTLLPLFLARPSPRPSVIYLPNINPATTLFSLVHANLLFLIPASRETEPLFVLEFLHRLVDVLEEFLGTPLLASKIEGSYDVVAQLLGEMCDAGSVCNTEPNALRDVVNMPGWMDKLLGGVGLPGPSPGVSASNSLRTQLSLTPASASHAIPWRRANVRHTSNELYVDIVETLTVTLAPSGRPLAAFANGSILFTSKLSGVPDLLLTLSVPSGAHTLARILELPVFHPCVRLARWHERPGELSFVPPDGRFLLAGYEVNLLPPASLAASLTNPSTPKALPLPATVELTPSLGPTGLEFEVRLLLTPPGSTSLSPLSSSAAAASASSAGQARARTNPRITPSFFGGSASAAGPSLHDVVVTIPLPAGVRNMTDLRASRGEAHFAPAESTVEWRLSSKESAGPGSATLRCTVVGPLDGDADADDNGGDGGDGTGDAEDGEERGEEHQARRLAGRARDGRRVALNRAYMPASAAVSFSVKGWLASGVRVESLNVDPRRSRGLGEGVRPVKGAKYLTVSRGGVETRC